MAKLVQTDGTETDVSPADPEAGFSLAELYRLLDCSIVEAVECADGSFMWLDEEGKIRPDPKPVNEYATELLRLAGGIPGDVVLGPVLIERGEVS